MRVLSSITRWKQSAVKQERATCSSTCKKQLKVLARRYLMLLLSSCRLVILCKFMEVDAVPCSKSSKNGMIPSRILRAAQAAPTEPKPFDFVRNPYKAKQTWPPDFEKLSDRHQFRLERRYKRRSKLKWARPRLMVATKLAQWIGGVC